LTLSNTSSFLTWSVQLIFSILRIYSYNNVNTFYQQTSELVELCSFNSFCFRQSVYSITFI
jgi:hypothetical protein